MYICAKCKTIMDLETQIIYQRAEFDKSQNDSSEYTKEESSKQEQNPQQNFYI